MDRERPFSRNMDPKKKDGGSGKYLWLGGGHFFILSPITPPPPPCYHNPRGTILSSIPITPSSYNRKKSVEIEAAFKNAREVLLPNTHFCLWVKYWRLKMCVCVSYMANFYITLLLEQLRNTVYCYLYILKGFQKNTNMKPLSPLKCQSKARFRTLTLHLLFVCGIRSQNEYNI